MGDTSRADMCLFRASDSMWFAISQLEEAMRELACNGGDVIFPAKLKELHSEAITLREKISVFVDDVA